MSKKLRKDRTCTIIYTGSAVWLGRFPVVYDIVVAVSGGLWYGYGSKESTVIQEKGATV